MTEVSVKTHETRFGIAEIGKLRRSIQLIVAGALMVPNVTNMLPATVEVSFQDVGPFDFVRSDVKFVISTDPCAELSMSLDDRRKAIQKELRKLIPRKFRISVQINLPGRSSSGDV